MKRVLAIALLACGLGNLAHAQPESIYFAEDFTAGAENWRTNTSAVGATYVATGGADGATDGYITSARSIGSLTGPFGQLILFRGQTSFNSSNGEFAGNWINDDVVRVEAMVRHDFDLPLAFGSRFATPANSPAASFTGPLVSPNVWTPITFNIARSNIYDAITNPTGQIVTFGGGNYDGVFGNIGGLQFSISPPAGLTAGQLADVVNFDFDAVSIISVPEPSTLALAGLVLVGGVTMYRRRK